MLADARCRKAILAALAKQDGASALAMEAALMLLLKLADAAGKGDDANVAGSDAWRRELALAAVPLVAAASTPEHAEPVRAQVAQAAIDLFVTDHSRHLFAFGQDLRTEETTCDQEFGNSDFLEIVYGRDSDEVARHKVERARTPQAAAKKRRGGLMQVDVKQEGFDEARALEKKKRKYAGPPSGKLVVYDEEECEALANAPLKKGLTGRLVSVLENVTVQRRVMFDGAKFIWETRDKASGHVAKVNAHNKYMSEFEALQGDPARLQEAKDKARKHNNKARLNPFLKRMPDPTVKIDLKDGLDPEGVVDVPPSHRELHCGQITACHTATVELLNLTGVPETAEVNALGCFVVRTTETAILCECIPDRPKFGPPPVTAEGKRKLAEETCLEWIQALLGLLEDEMAALGLEFDIAQFDPRAAAAAQAKDAKAKAKHRKEGQVEVLVKDPTAPTPMKWEDWVRRAAPPGEEDARGEPGPPRVPLPKARHPPVLESLWAMVLHPSSTALVSHGVHGLLNLCSEPGVCAHVRAKHQEHIRKVPDTLSTGVASGDKVLVARKLELLILLKELDLVEANLFRLDQAFRTRYKSVILNWRKHLGYSALSSATEGFDKQTLKRLQETFAEIDEDGSGYLSADELAALFKKLRMPMSHSKLEEIVDEVDIDGNGLIDFEEFLLVVKNMKNMKSVQSKLGVALAKGANSGVLGNFVGDATAGLFAGSQGLGGMFGPSRKVKLKKAIDDNRREKLNNEIKVVDKDVLDYQHHSNEFSMKRYQIKGDWVLVCKLVYAAALDWGDGKVTCEPMVQTLCNNPHWVEQLGFAKKTRGMRLDRHAQAKYMDTLRLAATYNILQKNARDAGLAKAPPSRPTTADSGGDDDDGDGDGDDDDAADAGDDDDDDEHWDYQTFEDNVVKLIRTFRAGEQRAKEEKAKIEENMERVAKKKPPASGRLRRLALGSSKDIPDADS